MYDSISVKYPEPVNPRGQRAGCGSQEDQEQGETAEQVKGFYQGDKNVLDLGRHGGHTTVGRHEMPLIAHFKIANFLLCECQHK